MSAASQQTIRRRSVEANIWLSHGAPDPLHAAKLPVRELAYEVLPGEEAVGRTMLAEINRIASEKDGSIVIVLVGGRGGQALHRLLGSMATTSEHDSLFS